MQVKVANGAQLTCDAEVKDFEWWIQGHTFKSDAKVLQMGAYDLVLGMDWLKRFSPMTCDWQHKWLEFKYNAVIIRLQGVPPGSPSQLQEVSMDQVSKWHKGDEICATVLVDLVINNIALQDSYLQNDIPQEIKNLIRELEPLFLTKSALPPSRVYDHAITLLPDAFPVNCRPYRYPLEQKDQIEMLQSGTIVHSLSPFASPVLLVRK